MSSFFNLFSLSPLAFAIISVSLFIELRDLYHKLWCSRNIGMITGGMTATARAADQSPMHSKKQMVGITTHFVTSVACSPFFHNNT